MRKIVNVVNHVSSFILLDDTAEVVEISPPENTIESYIKV